MQLIAENLCFGGRQLRYKHTSDALACEMTFSLFLPPAGPDSTVPPPLLYWLSGLTCTDENFVQKAAAQRAASTHGVAILAPDTSPRGASVPDDPDGAYDFGLGAGFYVNATEAPWSSHYRMYDYCVEELPSVVSTLSIDTARQSIFGHSMGGHGTLTIALNNPDRYRSVSAFAPICAPSRCPWGENALSRYLGPDRTAWRKHDATALIEDGAAKLPMRIDQGDADEFLAEQLCPNHLKDVCQKQAYPLEFQSRSGYDHSYFFIASFIDEHIAFHAKHLE